MISYIGIEFLYSSFLVNIVSKKNDFVWEKYVKENFIDKRIYPIRSAKKLNKKKEFISRLDLHGKTCDGAYELLKIFLKDACQNKIKKVTVITGSAYKIIDDEYVPTSILRREVPRWLLYTEISQYVKHFRYAEPFDGGNGAIYVYLLI